MQKLSYEFHAAETNAIVHGERGDKMYLIIDGRVGVWKPAPKRQSVMQTFKGLSLDNFEQGHGPEISSRSGELDAIVEQEAEHGPRANTGSAITPID